MSKREKDRALLTAFADAVTLMRGHTMRAHNIVGALPQPLPGIRPVTVQELRAEFARLDRNTSAENADDRTVSRRVRYSERMLARAFDTAWGL